MLINALSLIHPSQKVTHEKVQFSSLWRNMIRHWRHIKRVWSMIQTIRNWWMAFGGLFCCTFNLYLDCIEIILYWICCRCVDQVNKTNRGDIAPEELKERQVLSEPFPCLHWYLLVCWSFLSYLPCYCRKRQCRIRRYKTFYLIPSCVRYNPSSNPLFFSLRIIL